MASFHENGQPYVNTEHLFDFSQKFIDEYFPYCIEMARAFVQPKYQSAQMGRKALFALDNLWDGIGGLVASDPSVKYLSGKVTIYSSSPELSRKAMVYYLDKFFGDREKFEEAVISLYENEVIPLIPKGLCGAIYTQLSDVEDETNGFLTYDRKVLKVNEEKIHVVMEKVKI